MGFIECHRSACGVRFEVEHRQLVRVQGCGLQEKVGLLYAIPIRAEMIGAPQDAGRLRRGAIGCVERVGVTGALRGFMKCRDNAGISRRRQIDVSIMI